MLILKEMPYNKSEIDEGNILIADHLEWEKFGNKAWKTPFDNASYCNGEPTHICDFWNLKFHSDWNWLMLAYVGVFRYYVPTIYPEDILMTWKSIVEMIKQYEIDKQ